MFNLNHNTINGDPNSDWTQQPGYLGYDSFIINTFNEHNGLVMAARIVASIVKCNSIHDDGILTLINPIEENNLACIPILPTRLLMHTRDNGLFSYDEHMILIENMVKNWSRDLEDTNGWCWRNRLFVLENTYRSFDDFSSISDEILNIIERGPSNGVRVVLVNMIDGDNVPKFDFSNAIDPKNFNSIDI